MDFLVCECNVVVGKIFKDYVEFLKFYVYFEYEELEGWVGVIFSVVVFVGW